MDMVCFSLTVVPTRYSGVKAREMNWFSHQGISFEIETERLSFNPLQSGAAFVCTFPLPSGAAFMCTYTRALGGCK